MWRNHGNTTRVCDAPPMLTADAPFPDMLEPRMYVFSHRFGRSEFSPASMHPSLVGLAAHEKNHCQTDPSMTGNTVTVHDIVVVICVQAGKPPPCRSSTTSCVPRGPLPLVWRRDVRVQCAVGIQDIDHLKFVPLAVSKSFGSYAGVIFTMRSQFHVDIGIGDDRIGLFARGRTTFEPTR